jgi:hypothetical protein
MTPSARRITDSGIAWVLVAEGEVGDSALAIDFRRPVASR